MDSCSYLKIPGGVNGGVGLQAEHSEPNGFSVSDDEMNIIFGNYSKRVTAISVLEQFLLERDAALLRRCAQRWQASPHGSGPTEKNPFPRSENVSFKSNMASR
jgi:hypothetical protein